MTLFEIKEQFKSLMELDLDDQTLADTLESLEFDFEEKADNIAYIIKTLKAEAEAIKNEAKTLQERAKNKEINADRLKDYLLKTMLDLDKKKIETTRNVITIKKNPPSVATLTDFYNGEYMKEVVEVKLDKAKLKEDLKAGVVVDGAWLVQQERLEVK
jgi:seryl-tRNA synthetase